MLMVVDHADSLHPGVNNDGSDAFEAALLQRFGHGFRFRCLRYLVIGGAQDRFAAGQRPYER